MEADRKAGEKQKKEKKPKFGFSKYDMEDLYINAKIPKSLSLDLKEWSKDAEFRRALVHELNSFMFEKTQEKRLEESARAAVKVIDKLLLDKLPHLVVDVYLLFLAQHLHRIEKYLDLPAADGLYKFIPASLMVNYLSVFRLKLSDKEKVGLITELVREKDTCNQNLAKLPPIFQDKEHYGDVIVQQLIQERKDSVAAQVLKKLKMDKEKYPHLLAKLIEIAAISMPRWTDNFTWEILEEVFSPYPSAIAASIKALFRGKHTKEPMFSGIASICRRNPEVLGKLPQNLKEKLKDAPNNDMPNKLRNNLFQPSNPAEHFSLADFGYAQKNVILVNEVNLKQCLERVAEEKLIGIDTESRVARTTLDNSYDVLATIQIATVKEVFIFDALALKKQTIQLPQIQTFFLNKEVVVVGHTLSADLNGDVTSLLGFKGRFQCRGVDICPIFKGLFPEDRPGLASMTKILLGKELCKEYTLTNWERRPLLKNQVHYAALDAVIVLKLWEKLKTHPQYETILVKIKKEAEESAKKKNMNKEDRKEKQKEEKQKGKRGEKREREEEEGEKEEYEKWEEREEEGDEKVEEETAS